MKHTRDYALESRSNAWLEVFDLCIELGMSLYVERTGKETVLRFIRELQEERDELVKALKTAKEFIDLSPCDPDIYADQHQAWIEYQRDVLPLLARYQEDAP